MFSIGEFSKITGLTIKALRFYHEQGILVPAVVDQDSGYRYYDRDQIETARLIVQLRYFEFPLSDIKEILDQSAEDDLLEVIQRHETILKNKIARFRKAVRSLQQFISEERQARAMTQANFDVQEKTLEPILIAGVRMQGRYSDCGKGFGKIGRGFGRFIAGKPFLLHYDTEYKEEDADFEACMPVRQSKIVDGVTVRELAGGRCISLMHKGPYEQLGHSYAKILSFAKEKGYKTQVPSREIYHKGPGIIFKGNPKNYLTEIQMMIEPAGTAQA